MKDVNGIKLEVGQEVYDLSIEKSIKEYGNLDVVNEILDDGIILKNGKKIEWKGVGYFAPVAIKK